MPILEARSASWSVGTESVDEASASERGWLLAVKTSDARSLRVAADQAEEVFLRRAWDLCVDTLSEGTRGRHAMWRMFLFFVSGDDAFLRIAHLFGELVSDDELRIVPWHLAAASTAAQEPWYELPEWHSDHVSGAMTPLDRVDRQVSDHRDDDPRSWLVIV